ncbi:S8/S53 family peptidase [uncultured Dokdonia sp.]|uniref:S8 family peptidase n=1 Tax=uncultured Dokdonia sp. TaxID=575653 RepID=UPI002630D9EC|nr:S8/S53 family peptidase [uncultured Dokdonia sp.]
MKKTSSLVLGMCLLAAFSCTKDQDEASDLITENVEVNLQDSDAFLTIEEINALINQSFYEKQSFSWSEVPANVLWSATVHGGKVLTIGYGEKNESFRTEKNDRLDATRLGLMDLVQSSEQVAKKDFRVKEDEVLNVVDLEVTKLETIRELLASDGVRYLEPNGYSYYDITTPQGAKPAPTQTRSAGCDTSGSSLNSADYRSIWPGALVPWTFDRHNIASAWGRSRGAGITIGIIDTGLSPNQPLLGNSFGDGASINGRTVEKYGTYIDSAWWWSNNLDGPNDRCGHGTSMAGVAAGPRNNDGLPSGVAYDANLVMYRGTSDVVLNDYHERKGVSNALRALADRNDVDIISMSIGYPWSIGNVRDAVRYAYSRGKLIFAAGGTSTSATNWYPVIFPASMSEAVAVTGVTDWSGGYRECDVCHDGSEIQFTIVMERDSNDNRTTPVIGFNQGQRDYVGGSSVATATMAGVAAMVWSKYPNWSRQQVLNRLRQSSDLYGNTSSKYGYGNIDAYQAVQ